MAVVSPDTIAAIATAPGRAGVGIVRVSGDKSLDIARSILGFVPEPRRAQYGVFRDENGAPIDSGIAVCFASPASFTGEAVLELHGHGGPVVMQLLLARVLSLGARRARPGEFSERAFLNNKIDLAQAEAIADLIASSTTAAARAAARSLEGEFSRRVQNAIDTLIHVRMYVEAAIDFTDEELDFLSAGELADRLAGLQAEISSLLDSASQGHLLVDGMAIVITGRPNAGKSSLLNALAGRDRAIVTPVPGTTRDILTEHIELDGLPLHVSDTAGLHDSDDPVEQAGMARARRALQTADLVLLVIDDVLGWSGQDEAIVSALPSAATCIPVYNKIDLTGRPAGLIEATTTSAVAISLQTGAGLNELKTYLKRRAGFNELDSGLCSARARHVDALRNAQSAVETGVAVFNSERAVDLLAEDLRRAQFALVEITGEFTNEALLDRIFSTFCIGK